MRYKTFTRITWFGGICVAVLTAWGISGIFLGSGKPAPAPAPVQTVTAPPPAYVEPPPVAVAQPAPLAEKVPPTVGQLRAKLEDWLTVHGDRGAQMKWKDIFPDEPYQVTVLRFKDPDAAKFSNDARQWSQFRLDLDRDGVDDEKWLLKDGRTYKRETLDASGHSIQTEYFNK